ncbi:MAG TPA: serpin family protein [Nocardioidaceae bacterium]|nr:serpin family protein [Nocardioidaceae bacterium]
MLRRDLLRALGVTPLALPLLSACGFEPTSGSSGGTTSVELVTSDLPRSKGDPAAAGDAAASIADLATRLYDELGREAGNLAFSPYSIAVALAMTVNGARGTTAEEMLDVLAVEDLATFNGGLNALSQHLEGLAGKQENYDGEPLEVVLDTANSLWGQEGVTWQKPFLDVLAKDYGTGMRTVDYAGATEQAHGLINAWTAEQTRDKIPELIPDGVLDALTRLVLVNAIYLKAPWAVAFEESRTQDAAFTLRDGSRVDVPMMASVEGDYGIKVGEGWQAVRVEYAGFELAMTVVIPDDIEELPHLTALTRWEPDGTVALRLPRWKVRTEAMLKETLVALGMPTPFSESAADFSGMTHEAELVIAAVVHEAFVAVDEKGTEAAAATAVVMRDTSAGVTPEVVTVDRPFLYVIHDVEHGTPLFVGRVDDPSQES